MPMDNDSTTADAHGISQEISVGYRFIPTDEELVKHYLMKKVVDTPIPATVIRDIDAAEFYEKHPAQLVTFCHQKEWFFFVHLNKNYLNERRRLDRVIKDKKQYVWRTFGDEERVGNIDGEDFALKTTWKLLNEFSSKVKETSWKIEEFRMPSNSLEHKDEEWVLNKLIMGRGREDFVDLYFK